MSFRILRLKPGDESLAEESIKNIWTPYGSSSASRKYLTKFLTDDDHYLYVAMEDSKPVGMVLAYRIAQLTREQTMMYLHAIDVLPSHQNHGVGTALIEELKRICVEKGITKMWLDTSQSNLPAMALYEKTGGTRMGMDEAGFKWDFSC